MHPHRKNGIFIVTAEELGSDGSVDYSFNLCAHHLDKKGQPFSFFFVLFLLVTNSPLQPPLQPFVVLLLAFAVIDLFGKSGKMEDLLIISAVFFLV